MQKNLGETDRYIRLSAALFIITLFAADAINGTLAAVLLLLAANLIITGAISFGPIYYVLGINTYRKAAKA